MKSTMQEGALLISDLLDYGASVFSTSEVITVTDDGYRHASFDQVARRAAQLAHGLSALGVAQGDRVGSFLWNNQTHVEAYLGVPSMGAVLHTLNIRLPADQLVYVINHAEDRVIIIDDSLVPLLAPVRSQLETVETIIVAGDGDASSLGEHLRYEGILAGQPEHFDWPALDERDAAAMCYTSGTTGRPKGVVYSHRSTYLHSLAQTAANSLGLRESDRALVIVPMFHANAWGTPYSAWMSGADLIMPQHHLMGAALSKIIPELRPTVAAGVPTVWNDLLQVAKNTEIDASSLRAVIAGGSAVPRSLIEGFEKTFGLPIIQGWGMTETSPLGALALPPTRSDRAKDMDYRVKAGRYVAGVKVRVAAEDDTILPIDGESVGEFEVSGPWITGSYYLDDDPACFHDGWLRTGDVGTLDAEGFMTISDRTKDVIKSGGEWISSVELEGEVMAHPKVFEAAVIAVPDPRWQERPLVCVVPSPGEQPTPEELSAFLATRVARWWLPERWCFIGSIPKTSVGKFDKKVLRAMNAAGELQVTTIEPPAPA
jgi:fatty-acyl-CoA synthase